MSQLSTVTKSRKRRPGIKANIEPSAILSAACFLMAKHGFFEVSFQMIADNLGLSQSTIMHYYSNKTVLIRALIENIIQQNHDYTSKLIRMEDSAMQKLRAHFHGNLKWAMAEPSQASVILLLYYLGSVNKEFADLYVRVLSGARLRILDHLLASQREGAIKLELPPEMAAEILHDSLLSSLLNIVSTSDIRFSVNRVEAKWNQLFERVLSPQTKDKNFYLSAGRPKISRK